ncbi:hypothetical protein GCM10028787_32830 [Brachybacterium horti]
MTLHGVLPLSAGVGGLIINAADWLDDEDHNGRLLRYVETDAGDAGATLISEGYTYAWTPASEPDPDRLADYETATAAARDAGAGAWADCPDLDESS